VSGAAIGLQDVHDIRLSRARVGELQAQLDWQRALAEVAVEGAELATWDWNVTTGEARFNARWSEIIGYSSDDLMPSAGTWAEQTHPADVPRVKEMLRLVTEGLAPHYELQSRRLHRDGHWVWTRDFGSVTERDEAGRPIRISGIQEDISSRVRAQEELAASERHYRLLAENMSDAVWVVDAHGLITWVSDSSRRLLGWWSEHVVGREFTRLVHPDDRTDARRLLTAGAGGLSVGECRLRCADGSHRVVALSSTLSESGTETVVALHDVNSEVAARRALARASASDSLTGLANRAQVVQTAKEAVARLAESWHQGGSGTVAILVVGVDGLTAVNDALTHAGGDELLREVGQRLRGQLPTIGRGSGDEFVAVVEGARSRADLATMAEQLRTAAKGGVDLGGEVVFPTVSIGIATAGPGSNPEEILRDAATAMRAAKGQGRDQVAFIADDQASVARQRLHLEADIRRGLPAGEFAAWYQPVVALESGRTVGFEALVRWETASAQVIAPDSFLPVAERSTLIVEIDRAMLRQVVEFLARMPANLTVAANVSGRTLGEPGYFQAVEDELQRWGVAPHRLHLEVTETSLPGITDVTMQQVERLADLGVKWFADDFGTGYSSIAMLRDLPISGLKLDRSFTNRIGRGDPTSEQLARAIAGLAQEVGIDSVAEGVESEAEASVLLGQGWRHAQGWLYGRPARSPELG
ncbi:MAG: hypothetical protein QG597_3159, partial [Actinomycetota bacterium]|nr:hypothetical protein [Actinomycetota bacterium]